MSTFFPCKRKFFYQYVQKAQAEPGDVTAIHKGSCIHGLLQSHLDPEFEFNIHETKYRDDIKESALRIFHECKDTNSILQKLKAECTLEGTEVHVMLDENFEPCDNLKDAVFNGYIDLLYRHNESGKIITLDLKSGKEKKQTPHTHLDSMQVGLYSVWAHKFYNGAPVRGFYLYVEHNTYVYHSYTPEMLKDIENEAKKIINNIENESLWSKTGTPLCNWCGFQKLCESQTQEDINQWLKKEINQ